MRRLFYTFFIMLFFMGDLTAQINKQYNEDSLRAILEKTPMDTVRVNILNRLAGSYFFKRPDSTLYFASQALELARKLDYPYGMQ